jgi:hypothetical protein
MCLLNIIYILYILGSVGAAAVPQCLYEDADSTHTIPSGKLYT